MTVERYDDILALGVVILSRLSFFIGFHGVIGAFLLIRLLTEFYSDKTLRSLADTPYSFLLFFPSFLPLFRSLFFFPPSFPFLSSLFFFPPSFPFLSSLLFSSLFSFSFLPSFFLPLFLFFPPLLFHIFYFYFDSKNVLRRLN